MAFTGRLGSTDSLPGNIALGNANLADPLSQSVTSVLAFTSDAVIASIDRSISSTITFVSDASAVLDQVESAESIMVLTQSVGLLGPVYEGVGSGLTLGHQADAAHTIEVEVVQFIPFESVAGTDFPASASTTITFVSDAYQQQTVSSTLAFVQTATHAKLGGDIEHVLAFVQTATPMLILLRSLTSDLGLNSSATYRVERTCVEQNYTPFVGSGSSGITPPTTTVPTLGSATLTLTYPYTSPTTTLTLRNPDFRNQDSLNFNRINRETRGGTLVVYADPNWPKAQTLSLTISHLKQTQVDDLFDFLLESLGQEVGLLDHENRQWRGIILTPDAEVSHVGRENRSVQLEFEGALV